MNKTQEFIQKAMPLVLNSVKKYNIGVPSVILAQAIIESASGTSNKVYVDKNGVIEWRHNYLGIKHNVKSPNRVPSHCGYFYEGGSEQNSDGSYTSSQMCWEKFSDMQHCFDGYCEFLLNGWGRYDNLKGVTDAYQYLVNIRSDGYATSQKYVDTVWNKINEYNLTQYDFKSNLEPKFDVLVAIDAGHGSETAGKRSCDNYREHWINVMTANYCEKYLNANGIKTLRVSWNDENAKDDKDVPLTERQSIIKQAKCDYSVSFHANAHGNGKEWTNANGVETLIHNNSAHQKDSLKLAQYVQTELIKGTQQSNRGVKTQQLAMCNCSAMNTKASVLVEIGFMTNKREIELMKTESFCKEQGEDVARGILTYLGKKDNLPNTTTNANNISQNTPKSELKYTYQGLDYSLVFNPTYYSNKYADLKKAFGNDANKLFNHFCEYGMMEKRQANENFNVVNYMNRYADLRKAFGTNYKEYYKHYIQYGNKENRNAK